MTPQKSHDIPCSTRPATAEGSCRGASAVLPKGLPLKVWSPSLKIGIILSWGGQVLYNAQSCSPKALLL